MQTAKKSSERLPSMEDLFYIKQFIVTGVCDQMKSTYDESPDKEEFWADAFQKSLDAAEEALSAFNCAKGRVETFYLLDGMNRHFALLSGCILFFETAHQHHAQNNESGEHNFLLIKTKVYTAFIYKEMQVLLNAMNRFFRDNFIELTWDKLRGFSTAAPTPVFVDMMRLIPMNINPYD